jgi:hypothetical protein
MSEVEVTKTVILRHFAEIRLTENHGFVAAKAGLRCQAPVI